MQGRRSRRPSLLIPVRLHLVRVRLWLIGKLGAMLWHAVGNVWWHIMRVVGILGVVHVWLRHECEAVNCTRLRTRRPDRLAYHGRPHPPNAISR